MDWDRLEAFRAVARNGGFSAAARVLHKTQPAISQAVAALERDLDAALFEREGRQVRLTDAGRVLLEHAEESFAALDAARERIARLGRLEGGTLRLGASDTAACYLLPPVFAAYRARFPKVELRLDNHPTPEIAACVAESELDVGLVTLAPARTVDPTADDPRLVIDALRPREDVLICAPRHALARRGRLALADLAELPLLLLHSGTGSRALLDRAFAAARVTPRVIMEMGSVEVLKRLVELDFGVSVVPRFALDRELAAGTLAARRILPRRAWCRIGVVTRRRGVVPRPAEAFIAIAREVLGAPSSGAAARSRPRSADRT